MALQFNGGSRALSLVNPISSELTDMRPSILPTLLQAAQKNLNKGFDDLSIFEVGPIFKGDNPDEQFNTITGIRTGNKNKRDWKSDLIDYDFYDIKLDILSVLNVVGVKKNSLKIYNDAPNYFHPGRSAVFKIGQVIIANFGELHPEIYDFYGFKKPIIGFEIFHENIPTPNRNKTTRPMLNIASLQTVTREFAFIIDEDVDSEKIIQIVKLTDKDLIRNVIIYDIYRGDKIPYGKKSIAIKVVIQPTHQTLTDKNLENISSNIITNINKKLSGFLREE